LNAFPAVNLTVFAAGMVIASPVEGFRPARSARAPVENEPNPISWTVSPRMTGRHGLENGINGFGRAGLAPACGSRNGINQFVSVHL